MTMRRWGAAALIALGVVGTAPVARAQDGFRQTVVVTAAATPVELGSVTRAMTVITREQLAQLPVQTIADVLRLASSIDVRARGPRGVQTDFAVRGASFGQMLVMVDGVRLNDVQSGHHNGDIPIPLDAVERVEILYGPGSSLFGADAFGGTVNVITRREIAEPSLTVQGGSFGLMSGSGQAGVTRGRVRQTVALSADRSSGFIADRDFKTAAATARTSFGTRSGLSVSYQWKEFGARNFYGGNVPSREWTNQALVAADHRIDDVAGWDITATASYRTHGDRFLYDRERPLLSDNRHRTHALLGAVRGSRRAPFGASLTLGAETGGDWIRSSNLGDHELARASAFGEWRQAVGRRVQIDGTLRVDRYSEFGTAWNPSAGIGWWPADRIRLRASAGRAFRIPTFTERYYSDPSNRARPDIGPETAWAGEAGADFFVPGGWTLHATVFGRADDDVIDWLKPTEPDLWQTYNIRSVDTRGVELGARWTFGSAFAQAEYTRLDIDAAEVTQISKYILDYAPHSITAAVSLPLPARLRLAPRLEYRRRTRSTGDSDDVLLDARIGRRFGDRFELFAEGTNLLDSRYQEIAGVAMPGAAMSVSLAIRGR